MEYGRVPTNLPRGKEGGLDHGLNIFHPWARKQGGSVWIVGR